MANEEENDYFLSTDNDLQFTILTQIIQVTATMRHIDEFLLWFTNMLTTSRFGVQIAQIWATQLSSTGRMIPRLRCIASQDTTLADNIAVNTNVGIVVARCLADRRSSPCQPVDMLFSHHVSILLKRHGLYYSAIYFFSDAALLPPPMTGPSLHRTPTPTPLAISLLLFFRKGPQPDVLSTVYSLLKHAIPIVSNRGLLLSSASGSSTSPRSSLSSTSPMSSTSSIHNAALRSELALFELVPYRVEDMANNPFDKPALLDKQTRRLLASINGRRTLADLCTLLELDIKMILPMLQMLLKQQCIRICEPGGRPTNISVWLNNS